MSDRPKITVPAKQREAAENPSERRRKPVRPNAPVARDRVRREPSEAAPDKAEVPAPRSRPAAQRQDERGPRGTPAGHVDDRGRAGGRHESHNDSRSGNRDGQRQERRNAGRHEERTDPRTSGQPDRQAGHGRHIGAPSDQPAPRESRGPGRGNRPPQQHPAVPAPPRQAPEDGRVRLSKVMSEQGLASRREADDWIAQGWVRVDGEVVTELGTRIWPNQVVTIDAEARAQQAQRVTILLHKPIGYVSGQAEDGYEPAVTLVRPENRWTGDNLPWKLTRGHLHKLAPAGRLDIDSTGLLVLTQDGRIARQLIGEDALVEKEYLVRVQSMAQPDEENVSTIVPEEVLERLRHGLSLDDRALKPAKVSWQNEQQLRFVLREGRKRQIRRMCELVGLKVTGLKRVRMGQVVLGKLPLGQWRFLRPDERF